ncbi:hypothetical protein HY410_01940 [Candidatus Gottesmanbacteria bacterium]|nr:hypothetical protein [Candidatus Gottesmanbacteria bacterium]
MNVFVVIPTIRSLDFLASWEDLLSSASVIVVEDHKKKEIPTPHGKYQSVYHFTWTDIAKDFDVDEWIFSRQNAGIRSYGFWKAYALGADSIITLDDDCYPVDRDFIDQHTRNLSLKAPEKWINTYPHRNFVFTRGIPYRVRDKLPVVVSHGLWTNKIDLDAKTQLKVGDINMPAYPSLVQFIPRGIYFPMCSMNLAFRREITPLMYFPLMGFDPYGKPWGYDRFDDIWAGIFAKKICDHLGVAVVNGSPFVEHRKASDPHKNLLKEKKGMQTNETLWKAVDQVVLTQKTPVFCYAELVEKIHFPKDKYFKKLREAMMIWANLFLP